MRDHRRQKRQVGRAAAVAVAALGLVLVVPGVAAASTPTPPDNPATNIPSPISGSTSCAWSSSGQATTW